MGVAQGQPAQSRIRKSGELLRDLEAFRRSQPRWMPYLLYRGFAETTARRFLLKALAGSAEMHQQRLNGIAAGVKLPRDRVYLLNALEPMLASVQGRTQVPLALGACSAVAVRGRRSLTGESIIARNFDYLPLVQSLYMIRENRPADGYRLLVFTAAPLAGAVDGMSEDGLCITHNYAFPTDAANAAPPLSMLIEETLATCVTVEAAADRLLSRPRWGQGC